MTRIGFFRCAAGLIAALLALTARPALADFHFWEIREVFSNEDGTVQFVEMFNFVDGEDATENHTLRAAQGAQTNDFVFPGNLPSFNTSNRSMLLATSGFADLDGAPTPDFILPDNFLFRPDGTVDFIGATGFASYDDLPTDGLMSLNFPGGDAEVNMPTNFNGESATITAGTRITGLPPVPKGTISIEVETIATGLVSPLGLVELDDDSGRMLVWDQAGQVWVIENGTRLGTPMLDVADRLVDLGIAGPGSFDERGLLGLAPHPDFASNPRIYTYTSEPTSATADFTNVDVEQHHQAVIAEWTLTGASSASNTVDTSTRRELLRVDEPQFNHNGGTVTFGPDGFLYISLGDGGASNDIGDGHVDGGNAQDTSNIYGSVLRIDPSGTAGAMSANGQYSIPPDNPFVGGPGLDEIYVHGLRNPYLLSFDIAHFNTTDFRLYIGDAGQHDMEEINLVTADRVGGNYGWPVREGSFYFNVDDSNQGFISTAPDSWPIPEDLIDPHAEYARWDGETVHNGTVVIGGHVYRGSAVPELAGRYVFGDFGTSFGEPSGRLWYLDESDEVLELKLGTSERPLGIWVKGFGQDRSGEVYVLGSQQIGIIEDTGVVYRLKEAPEPTRARSWTHYE